MHIIGYGNDKQFKQRYCGVDIATGQGQDYTSLAIIDNFSEKIKTNDFPEEYENIERFVIVELLRERNLDLDAQIKWLTRYIEGLDPRPIISVDATRELSVTLQLRNALPRHQINKVIWTGGSHITREGLAYYASKVQALMDFKSLVAMGRLTIAPDLPLKDVLISELLGFVFEESPSGGFTIRSNALHDDVAYSALTAVIPLLQRRILERKSPHVVPSLEFSSLVNQ
jgi:hypothetical protein